LFADCATVAQCLAVLNALLRAAGLDNAESDARSLVCAAFGIARLDLVLRPDANAGLVERTRLEGFAIRRLQREPVTRILGARGFWNIELAVRPNVLDPRPDTEVLVEACIDALGARVGEPLAILDVGTGSGALIAALLKECPYAHGWAIDVSADAVEAATANLAALGLASRATVWRQSWADALPTRFDLVVSNPPYIATGEIAHLDPEVRDFDPRLALDGGADGLDAYRAIAAHRRDWVKPGGLLAVEIGSSQAASVKAIFEGAGARLLELREDYGGRDRALVFGERLV
jgi:release factor glutamine methyltransferase